MIPQPPPNFKTQFSPKDEVGSYDNIALIQRYKSTEQANASAVFIEKDVPKDKNRLLNKLINAVQEN